jgi:hypothetical protein
MEFMRLGVADRIGYDVQVARSCCQFTSAHAIDCTFWWSRWSRWLCCPATLAACPGGASASANGTHGERQPLVIDNAYGDRTPNRAAPTPQRLTTEKGTPEGSV